jgi:hypothetical protein
VTHESGEVKTLSSPFVPGLNTPVPFTTCNGRPNLWPEQFLGRAVRKSVPDSMSLGRSLFLRICFHWKITASAVAQAAPRTIVVAAQF